MDSKNDFTKFHNLKSLNYWTKGIQFKRGTTFHLFRIVPNYQQTQKKS